MAKITRKQMLEFLKEDGLEVTPKGRKSFNKVFPKTIKKVKRSKK